MTNPSDSENLTGISDASQASNNSGESSDEQNSQEFDYGKLAAALASNDTFNDVLGKAVQSQKDRRFDGLERKQEEQDTKLDRVLTLIDDGVSPQEAKKQVDLEDTIAWVQKQQSGDGTPASEAAPEAVMNIGDSLQQAGIDPNSDIGKSMLENIGAIKYSDRAAMDKAVRNEMVRRLTKPAGNPAGAIASAGKSPQPQDDMAEYQEKLAAITPGDMRSMLNLKREYREKGLPVF